MRKYPSFIRVSENCIDPNSYMVKRQDQDNFPCFTDAGMVRMGIYRIYVFKSLFLRFYHVLINLNVHRPMM